MRTARSVAVLTLAAALVAGIAGAAKKNKAPTAPGTYHDWNGDLDQIEIVEAFDLAGYQRLVVGDFDTSATPLSVGLKLTPAGLAIVRQQGAPPAEPSARLLRGRVREMDPGSAAARAWAGFGAGATRAKLEGELVDAASGRVLIRFTQERRSGVGLGEGYVKMMQRNLRAIGEDLGAGLQQF
jgi:hypothetical protein